MISLSRVRIGPPEGLGRVEDFMDDFAVLAPSFAAIDGACADFFGIATMSAYYGRRRFSRIALARQVAWWLAGRLTAASRTEIARHFKRDQTTVGHGIRRIEEMRKSRPEIRAITDHLEKVLGAP